MFDRLGIPTNHYKNNPFSHNLFDKCLKGYHSLIYGEISGKSLPALAVFVNPLDLRLGLFLGYEHSWHAWLGRFALTHSQRHTNTEIYFLSLHGGLIFSTSVYRARA